MDLKLLDTLTQTFGPSGYEDAIRDVLLEAVEPHADEVRVDTLGSLIALRKGAGEVPKKVILAAHMDEIGVIATHVEESGFVRFTSLGGVRALSHVGQRVVFHIGSDVCTGVIYLERMDPPKLPGLRNLYVDVGATSRDDCPVHVGDTGVFVGPLAQQGTRLVSKAMDDRVGCYILVEIMRRLESSPNDVYFAFTTQEEVGLVGARTSAFRIDPDLAVSIDVTATGDMPKSLPMDVSLGKGPAVKVKDSGMIAHPLVRDGLVAAAEEVGSPYQMEILVGGTTDAAAMQLTRSGVPSGCLSVPCRYVHSTAEMVDAADVEHAVDVLLAFLSKPV